MVAFAQHAVEAAIWGRTDTGVRRVKSNITPCFVSLRRRPVRFLPEGLCRYLRADTGHAAGGGTVGSGLESSFLARSQGQLRRRGAEDELSIPDPSPSPSHNPETSVWPPPRLLHRPRARPSTRAMTPEMLCIAWTGTIGRWHSVPLESAYPQLRGQRHKPGCGAWSDGR